MSSSSTFLFALLAFAQSPPASPGAATGRDAWDFERDVRGVLRAHCLACHGPNEAKGGLRLDSRAALLERDEPVLVPGDPAASELVRRLRAEDPDERMPQKAAPLAADAIARLAAWIADGAPWPAESSRAPHWAYVAPSRPAPPVVRDAAWCRNAIDRFVLARLEQEGLAPAAEAPRDVLVRRLHLDLTGLPPTRIELDAALDDRAPDALERLAARLLASPHYAEHQARAWLDLARYADTNGYEKDDRRGAWPWRDAVIAAFARDQGFDQFTLEQLAGDLLPDATRAQRVASGFHRNTLVNQEGGTDPEEFRYAAVIDRVNTTASVWLGSTLACAQCHDHKYDPFSQKDYYRFFAFFDQTEDTGNELAPVLALPSEDETRELDRIARERAALDAEARTIDADAAARVDALRSAPPPAARWRALMLGDPPNAPLLEALGAVDGSVVLRAPSTPSASGAPSAPGTARVELGLVAHDADPAPVPNELRLLRIDLRPAEEPPPNTMPERVRATLRLARLARGVRTPIPLVRASVERVAAPGGIATAARSDGSVALDLDLPTKARDPFSAVYLEPREPAAAGGTAAWLLELDFERAPSAPLRLVFAATDDAAAARRVAVLEAAPWERAPARAVESTGAALAELDREAGPPSIDAAAWTPAQDWRDARPIELEGERRLHVVRRRFVLREPSAVQFELGGDDAFRAWIDGERVAGRDDWPGFLERQERVARRLAAGNHVLVLAIPNSSGPGQFWCDLGLAATERAPELVAEALRGGAWDAERRRAALAAYAHSLASERRAAQVPERGRLDAEERTLRARIATTPVMRERAEPRTTRLHARGGYLNLGEIVEPGVPAVLPQLPATAPRNRLGLARWLVDPANPLTARVAVNRVWERLFGRGLVASSADFGTRGDAPSHPELLDWLAVEFVEHGWSFKHLLATITASATYRASSAARPAELERDPENALLARGAKFRLDAETVRDVALVASGLLAPKVGGPSVMPPQPDGVWAPVYSSDAWRTDEGESRYRRGLYTFWKRSSPYATFAAFDAPSREVACTRRARTNTPLQALALLNDPAFVECADALAARMLREGATTPEARARAGFRACTSREPSEDELSVLVRLHASELADARAGAARDPDHVAWSRVANVLLNLDETITRH